MKINGIFRSLSNVKWIGRSIKQFVMPLILIVVLNALTSLGSVVMAIASKNIIDLAVGDSLEKAAQYGALYLGLIVFSLAVNANLSVYATKVQEKYSNFLRQRVFSKLINVEWLQVSRYHSGDLLTRLTSDMTSIAHGSISVIPQIIALGVQFLAAFVTLMYYEPSLAILAFLLAPFTILFSRYFGRKLKHLHVKMQESESSYRSHVQEHLQNILVVKTFNMEEKSLDKADELQNEKLQWVTKKSKTGAAANTILSAGYWAGYLMAFGWGAVKLASKTATFGTLTAFLQLVNQIQGPFLGLSRTLPQIISALASAGRIAELDDMNSEAKGKVTEAPAKAGLCFNNVSFRYEKDEAVLDNVSMEASPGEIIALVGSSGEGKTTMIRLMLALLKPDNGRVFCFDVNGGEYAVTSSTRNWFSYVPQGNTLFSGSIADNLRSAKTDATDDEMKAVLETACALEFVERLPERINTQIGEKAHKISEGQAQRIAIARALLRKAPILILDEATSALDIELEEKVINGIRDLKPKRTCIFITHRRTTFGICDRIYKLTDGMLDTRTA